MDTNLFAYGNTNQHEITPQGVLKRYLGPGAINRWQTESSLLPLLKKSFSAVPQLMAHDIPGEMVTLPVEGEHAQHLIEQGKSAAVLSQLGKLLVELQQVPVQKLQGILHGNGSVLVHGDYGPQNLLLREDAGQPALLLDWEWAHLGDPVEDAAWLEWTICTRHGRFARELPIFFEAYGVIPLWAQRHEAMLMQCARQLEFARMVGKRKSIQQWQSLMQLTRKFQSF